jgi:hypothetical protein
MQQKYSRKATHSAAHASQFEDIEPCLYPSTVSLHQAEVAPSLLALYDGSGPENLEEVNCD